MRNHFSKLSDNPESFKSSITIEKYLKKFNDNWDI